MIDVLIVGAGPVGTLLSAELARRGVDARVVERRPRPGAGSRAVGIHSLALSAMEASGATDLLLSEARRVRIGEARARGRTLGTVRFDRLRSRHPYVATLAQERTEHALGAVAERWGARPVARAIEVESVEAAGPTAVVRVAGEDAPLSARIVVIAGGGRARHLTPSPAAERAYRDRYVMADAPDAGDDGDMAVVHLDPDGVLESFPLPGGMRRYVAWMRARDGADEAERLRDAVAARTCSRVAAATIVTATSFGVRRALVARMASGSIVTIGDAAHEVSPIGGQGMNLGLIDAVTLAPHLARWVRSGRRPDEIDAWAASRRKAAALSARIAAANTVVGRPSAAVGRFAVRAALRLASTTLARAYGMGFDPAARSLDVSAARRR